MLSGASPCASPPARYACKEYEALHLALGYELGIRTAALGDLGYQSPIEHEMQHHPQTNNRRALSTQTEKLQDHVPLVPDANFELFVVLCFAIVTGLIWAWSAWGYDLSFAKSPSASRSWSRWNGGHCRFLENGGYDHHLRRIRRLYARRAAQVLQARMKAFPDGTRASCPQGGFVLWVELPGQFNSLHLYDRALAAGIGIAPGPMFSPSRRYQNFIRLSCTGWSDEIERAIIRLGQLVRELLDGPAPRVKTMRR